MGSEPRRVCELLVRQGVLDAEQARQCLREYTQHEGEISFLGSLLLAGLIDTGAYERMQASLVLDSADAAALPTIDLAAEATEQVAALRPRSRLIGGNFQKYELVRELGRGGMGAVWLARDRDLERLVAVKQCQDPGPDVLERFVREAQIGSQLDHPNIAPIYDAGMASERMAFFAMKFIQGTALSRVLDKLAAGDRAERLMYPLRRRLDVLTKALEGVAYAHAKSIVHRDLKPDNIMIGRHGEVLVVDWGLARATDAVTLDADAAANARPKIARLAAEGATLDGAIMGTPGYMSPEQARGETARIDATTDVYAMGAILYEMLALTRAFPQKDVMRRLAACADGHFPPPSGATKGEPVPPALEAICLAAMAPEPKDRYPTAEAMLADVRAYLDDRPITVYRASVVERLRARVRRHTGVILAAALAMTALAVAAGLAARESGRRYEEEQGKLAAERQLGAANESRTKALAQTIEALATQSALEERARRAADARARAFAPFLDARAAMAWTIDTRTLKEHVVPLLETALRIDPSFVEARLDLISALGYLERPDALQAQVLGLYTHLAPEDRERLAPVFGPLAIAITARQPVELPANVDDLRPAIIPRAHWEALVTLLRATGHDPTALACVARLAESPGNTNRWELHLLHARMLTYAGECDEASRVLGKQIRRFPQIGLLYVARAACARDTRPEQAREDLARALELDPYSHSARAECANLESTAARQTRDAQSPAPEDPDRVLLHLMAALRQLLRSLELQPIHVAQRLIKPLVREFADAVPGNDPPRNPAALTSPQFARELVAHVRATRERLLALGVAAHDPRIDAMERNLRAGLVLLAHTLAGLEPSAQGGIARMVGTTPAGLPGLGRELLALLPEARVWLEAGLQLASPLERPDIEALLNPR